MLSQSAGNMNSNPKPNLSRSKIGVLERTQLKLTILFCLAVIVAGILVQFYGNSQGISLSGDNVQGISTTAEID